MSPSSMIEVHKLKEKSQQKWLKQIPVAGKWYKILLRAGVPPYKFYIFIPRNSERLNTLETSNIEHNFLIFETDPYASLNNTVEKICLKTSF